MLPAFQVPCRAGGLVTQLIVDDQAVEGIEAKTVCPRSIQKRKTSCMAAWTSGLFQLRLGCSG